MSQKIIFFIFQFFKFHTVVFARRLVFLLSQKKKFDDEFLRIHKDENFSQSLIVVEFYYPDLLWVQFPQVGKKLYNGSVTLIADKVNYPYRITVKTRKRKKIFIIENFDALYHLESRKFTPEKLENFSRVYNKSNSITIPRANVIVHKLGNKVSVPQLIGNSFSFTAKNKNTSIKHQPFNSNDFI